MPAGVNKAGSDFDLPREAMGALGQGGMATVYLAEALRHHRKGAVKVLGPELAAATSSRSRW